MSTFSPYLGGVCDRRHYAHMKMAYFFHEYPSVLAGLSRRLRPSWDAQSSVGRGWHDVKVYTATSLQRQRVALGRATCRYFVVIKRAIRCGLPFDQRPQPSRVPQHTLTAPSTALSSVAACWCSGSSGASSHPRTNRGGSGVSASANGASNMSPT